MPTDYEALTESNVRELGRDAGSRWTQIAMYSDSTHFIYEILQNADDHGATEVGFSLGESELTIEHDGQPFTTKNVKAITYFGKGTSRDDRVKAGRFGVGFKSVFAFTASPTIHSGDEHFQIYGLYRARVVPPPDDLDPAKTRIILPFDHYEQKPDYMEDEEHYVSRKEACEKIADRLAHLNMSTLLFTRNVREVRWNTPRRSGHYYRVDKLGDGYRTTSVTDGDTLVEYLVFSRTPFGKRKEYNPVEIAFRLEDGLPVVDDAVCLRVLFTTEQETHLKFILNGPYRTNPSRERIATDDAFNRHLMKETCTLMAAVLPRLRDMKLLTVQTLAAFPNASDDRLAPFFEPLSDVIRRTFKAEPLVPTDQGAFAAAGDVLQGPARLREVITSDELSFLSGQEDTVWAKGATPNSRSSRFLHDLGISEWGYSQLQSRLVAKFGEPYYEDEADDVAWLSERTDAWLQKLYLLLGDAMRKDECSDSTLAQCRIVRVREDGREAHVEAPRAYFPKQGYPKLPQVKRAILRGKNEQVVEKVHSSLVDLGVREIGEQERAQYLLDVFYSDASTKVTTKRHLQHMVTFIKSAKKSAECRTFTRYAIFRHDRDGTFHKGSECYMDVPLRKSGLDVIYGKPCRGLPKRFKLWSGYGKLSKDGFHEFAGQCGVLDCLRIESQDCRDHPEWGQINEAAGDARENSRTKTSEDHTIAYLELLLRQRKLAINLLIWHTVSKAVPEILAAVYRPNRQHEEFRRNSSLVLALTAAEWLPDTRRCMRKPCDMTRERLHPDFKYDNRNGWLDAIGFGESAKRHSEEHKRLEQAATESEIPVELVEYVSGLSSDERRAFGERLKVFVQGDRRRAVHERRDSRPFHEVLGGAFSAGSRPDSSDAGMPHAGDVRNPARRRERTAADIAAAVANEPDQDGRSRLSVKTTWNGRNDQVRVSLEEWYGGRCQVCGKTFLKRNGKPYFEGLYLVSQRVAEWIDRVGNVLCLCAWHCAMFQHGSKEFERDVNRQIMGLKPRAEGATSEPAIEMNLCGEPIRIVFHDRHLIDLQEMIRHSSAAQER